MISEFAVILSENAVIQLNGLPKEIQQIIANRLTAAKIQPFHFFIRLKNRTDYKMRCGDYRAIADIDSHERRIFVTKVGHRRDVYEQ
ncbi:MAG: type II toxin-antitoxin system RelE/ParE family toxin [Candidatus Nanoarchaeia archaeon]|nr:type II toxin-antitoxin system RelE/ParE family toxin [Candidatus Nanoarchaeia archaeon]MDD5239166.1 type II toxin-antitoxin system RelE/ParE family toxin [Candidatus Nanoarchaeia archaeon]